MNPTAYSSGMPLLNPGDTPVEVTPGMVSIAPEMNIQDCNNVAMPIMYIYIPSHNIGVDLSSAVSNSCSDGIATFSLRKIDLSNNPGLIGDIYYGR